MTCLEELEQNYPDLVEGYKKLSKAELLEAICAEVLDLHNMNDRVQLFMAECTTLSKTNYTLDAIKTLITYKQEDDINQFCHYIADEESDESILEEVKGRAEQYR